MKKVLLLLIGLSIITFGMNGAWANDTSSVSAKTQAKQSFEQRLNLSEKQKQKAKEIHQKGFEQMKPVMTKIGQKKKEIDAIKNSNAAENVKQEQLNQKFSELKALNAQAREIRKANSKEFENILNKKQKKELEQMKAEGRARFERNHPPRPPFEGMPNFKGFEFKSAPDFGKVSPLPVPSAPQEKK